MVGGADGQTGNSGAHRGGRGADQRARNRCHRTAVGRRQAIFEGHRCAGIIGYNRAVEGGPVAHDQRCGIRGHRRCRRRRGEKRSVRAMGGADSVHAERTVVVRGADGQTGNRCTHRGVGASRHRALISRHCGAIGGGGSILEGHGRRQSIGIDRTVEGSPTGSHRESVIGGHRRCGQGGEAHVGTVADASSAGRHHPKVVRRIGSQISDRCGNRRVRGTAHRARNCEDSPAVAGIQPVLEGHRCVLVVGIDRAVQRGRGGADLTGCVGRCRGCRRAGDKVHVRAICRTTGAHCHHSKVIGGAGAQTGDGSADRRDRDSGDRALVRGDGGAVAGVEPVLEGDGRGGIMGVHRTVQRRTSGGHCRSRPSGGGWRRRLRGERHIRAIGCAVGICGHHPIVIRGVWRELGDDGADRRVHASGNRTLVRADGGAVAGVEPVLEGDNRQRIAGVHGAVQGGARGADSRGGTGSGGRRCARHTGGERYVRTVGGAADIHRHHPVVIGGVICEPRDGLADRGCDGSAHRALVGSNRRPVTGVRTVFEGDRGAGAPGVHDAVQRCTVGCDARGCRGQGAGRGRHRGKCHVGAVGSAVRVLRHDTIMIGRVGRQLADDTTHRRVGASRDRALICGHRAAVTRVQTILEGHRSEGTVSIDGAVEGGAGGPDPGCCTRGRGRRRLSKQISAEQQRDH